MLLSKQVHFTPRSDRCCFLNKSISLPNLTDAAFWTSPFHSLIWQMLLSEQVHFTPWSDRCCFLNKSISLPDLTDAAFWTSPFHSLIWQMLLPEQVHFTTCRCVKKLLDEWQSVKFRSDAAFCNIWSGLHCLLLVSHLVSKVAVALFISVARVK